MGVSEFIEKELDLLQVILSSRAVAAVVFFVVVLPVVLYAVFYYLYLRPKPIKGLKREECIVMITGCDTGFGYMLALALTARGYPVVATCYTSAGVKELEEKKVFKVLQCDVTKAEDVERVAKTVEDIVDASREQQALGSPGRRGSKASVDVQSKPSGPRYKLWAVVNNAGIAPTGLMDYLPLSAARQVFEVNFFAVIQVIQTLLPLLKTSKNSRIINVSSAAGFSGFSGGGYYCGSKHAIEGLMKCLRQELVGWNIHVCNVNPGFMKTPLITTSEDIALKAFRNAPKNITNQYPEEQLHDLTKFIHMVEEDPIKVVNQMIRLIESQNPLLVNPTGIQANIIRWANWFTPHHLYCAVESFLIRNSNHGPYRDVVKSLQRETAY